MTSFGPPLPVPEDDALDTAASAVADGVASPEEESAVAAAPNGAARVAAFRAVAGAVGAPAGVQDPRAAARALAAALAGLDRAVDDDATGDAPEAGTPAERRAPVSALPPSPARPRPGRNLPRLAAVAAALVLLVGVAGLAVAALRSSEEGGTFTASAPADDSARAANASPTLAGPTAEAAAGQVAPPAAPAAATAPAATTAARATTLDGGDLGRQDDAAALIQRVAAALDGVPDEALAGSGAALPRDVQACATAGRTVADQAVGALRYRAVGSFRGTPAVFLAYERFGGPPPYLLLVLARDGCAVLSSTSF